MKVDSFHDGTGLLIRAGYRSSEAFIPVMMFGKAAGRQSRGFRVCRRRPDHDILPPHEPESKTGGRPDVPDRPEPVSYTHLTLPTISPV